VLDYRVSWDQGVGTWDIRQSGLSTLSYTASSLTAGTVYSFRVEARNAYGYSEYSAEVAVLAASRPSTPLAPTTMVDGSNILVSWQEPDINGSPIESYTISLRQWNYQYSVNTEWCDGSQPATIYTRTCTIPQSVFGQAPYLLSSGAGIYAKVIATNAIGSSNLSTAGNGAMLP